MTELKPDQLDLYIEKHNKPILVEFTTRYCSICRFLSNKFNDLNKKFPSLIILKVDITDSNPFKERYNILSVPTFVLLTDHNVKTLGNMSNMIVLEKAISDNLK